MMDCIMTNQEVWGRYKGAPIVVVAAVETTWTDAGVSFVWNMAVDHANKRLLMWTEVWR